MEGSGGRGRIVDGGQWWEREGRDAGGNARRANRETMTTNLLSLFNEREDFCLQGLLDFY